jgi:hypothetical protein
MDSLLAYVSAVTSGFLAGALLLSRTGSWIYALASTVETYRGGDSDALPRRPLLWALPLAAILHSGPWLLALAAYLSYYVLSRPHAPWWSWFFGAACMVPIAALVAPLTTSRRKRKANEHTSRAIEVQQQPQLGRGAEANEPH